MRLAYHLFTKHSEILGTKDAARAKAINVFGLIVTFCCIIYFSIFVYQDDYTAALSIGVLALICVFPIVLNTLCVYRLARYVYSFQAPLVIFFYSCLFGKDLDIQIFLIITFAFPFIFLKSSEKTLILIFFVYNSLLLILLEFVSFPFLREIPYDTELKPFLKLVVYLTSILFTGILFFIFFRAIRVTEQDLLEAKFAAEKASNARKEFLATMSHEIRTPLNAVITIASMLEDKDESDREELVKTLQLSSKTLLNIINDILEFSKLEAGKISLHYKPTDLGNLMEEIRKAYEVMCVEKGIGFKLDFDPSISKFLEIDDLRLSQIMGNLIGNAIKFTEKGSVNVSVKKAAEVDGYEVVHFSVRDTGIGIRKEELGDIFDSFNRGSMEATQKFGGTGLGLSIVRRLLEKHESNIQVTSEYLKGTEFSFDLKMKIAEGNMNVMKDRLHRIDLDGMSILVVEDNKINAMIAHKLLTRWGAAVDLADNGHQAVQKAASNKYDLILMDIHMPDIDGYEATRQIRLLENGNAKIPIFVLSADVMITQKKGTEGYFDGILSKPVDQRQLYEAIASVAVDRKES